MNQPTTTTTQTTPPQSGLIAAWLVILDWMESQQAESEAANAA